MESKWISVKDRLPVNYQDIIIYSPDWSDEPMFARCVPDNKGIKNFLSYEFEWDIVEGVTHLMPLPEPPKK